MTAFASPEDAAAVAGLLARIHVPPTDGTPTLGEVVRRRLAAAEAQGRASPEKLVWARATLARLERDSPPAVLLHGRLDASRLLVGPTGLVAVDPEPCAGDPAYDAATWVHSNRRPGRRARLEALLAATGLPRERVRDWAGVIGVHG